MAKKDVQLQNLYNSLQQAVDRLDLAISRSDPNMEDFYLKRLKTLNDLIEVKQNES